MVGAKGAGVDHILAAFEYSSEADRLAVLGAAFLVQPGGLLHVAEWVELEDDLEDLRDWAIEAFTAFVHRHDPAGQVVALDAHQDQMTDGPQWGFSDLLALDSTMA